MGKRTEDGKTTLSIKQKQRMVARMLASMHSTEELRFVLDHYAELNAFGLIEVAVVQAWDATKTSHYNFDTACLEAVLKCWCHRKGLRLAGDPLPSGETFTVYRGVCGKGRFRKARGLAWTADLSIACWFAMRYATGGAKWFVDPAVYEATITADEVFFYVNHRNEQEFVCRPKRCKRMPLTLEEMDRLAEEERQRRQVAWNASMKQAPGKPKSKRK